MACRDISGETWRPARHFGRASCSLSGVSGARLAALAIALVVLGGCQEDAARADPSDASDVRLVPMPFSGDDPVAIRMGGIDYIIPFNYFVPTIWEERLPRQTHIYLWADLPGFEGLTDENRDDFYGVPGAPDRHVRALITDTVWRAYRNRPEDWQPEGWEPSARCGLLAAVHGRIGLTPPPGLTWGTWEDFRPCNHESIGEQYYQDIVYNDGPFGLLEIDVPQAWHESDFDLREGRVDLFSDGPVEQLTTIMSCLRVAVVPNPNCTLFTTHNGLVLKVTLDRDDLAEWQNVRDGWFALLDGFAAEASAEPAVFQSLVEDYLAYLDR